MGPGTQTPVEGTWDQAARQEVASHRDPQVDRMTDASENITLPKLRLRVVKMILCRPLQSPAKDQHILVASNVPFQA